MKVTPEIFENTEVAYAAKSNIDLQKSKVMFQIVGNNMLVNAGASLAQLALGLNLPVSSLFRFTVYNHFCGGETFDECKQTIKQLQKNQVGVLLNYGVELKETEDDFERAIQQNIEAIEFAGNNKSVKAVCIKLTGFGRFTLFEKVQSKQKLTVAERKELLSVKKRLEKLCAAAEKNFVTLYVDAEESWIQNPLDELVEEMMRIYNKNYSVVCNTFQLYRYDRLAYLQDQIQKAKAGNYFLGAKLVRGAYMEKERERAEEKNYLSPIHANKESVDKDFDKAVSLCLDNISQVLLCVASQSEASNLLAVQEIDKRKIERNNPHVVFSQLYGMGDNITFNLAKLGFNATKYLPYGPVKEVIPYLIRRAQENTSVEGQMGRELSLLKKEITRRKKSGGG